jgi:NAD(P)-dependent dehydrogenase (short-subunit alcohol dehydrogenase family)
MPVNTPPMTTATVARAGARATILDRFRLDGKSVIVTGGSSGLGVHFAQAFASAGADVIICGRRPELLERTQAHVEALGRRCVAITADVTDVAQCQRVVEGAHEAFGKVDVLINNAGIGAAVPATQETPEQFTSVISVNLFGTYWMAQACARVMRPGSCIVNVGSVLGSTTAGLPQAAYSASKAAIIGLTRDLAQLWARRKGIRVNALAPGLFESEMTDGLPQGYHEDVLRRVPLGRLGDGPEVAAAAVFLASDAATYITGVLLPVDGGMLIA